MRGGREGRGRWRKVGGGRREEVKEEERDVGRRNREWRRRLRK